MKQSEIRELWRRVEFWWRDGAVVGPKQWAREVVSREMKIAALEQQLAKKDKEIEALIAMEYKVRALIESAIGGDFEKFGGYFTPYNMGAENFQELEFALNDLDAIREQEAESEGGGTNGIE